MKLVWREPCRECPFRVKSARGWLGPHTPQGLWEHVHRGGQFACHMSIDKVMAQKENPDGHPDVERCVGSLLHSKKTCKRVEEDDARAFTAALSEVCKTPVLGFDFIEHHTLKRT